MSFCETRCFIIYNYNEHAINNSSRSDPVYFSWYFSTCSVLKNSRQDSRGISTLKDKENNTLHSDNIEKANLLDQQFQSFFFFFFFFSSRLSPLRLGQLSAQII